MTVVTRQRSDNFAIIPNAVSEDYRLSFEARGLLCYLLAKPNNWRVDVADIQRAGGIGRDKAYRLLKELRETGYIQVVIRRDASQKILEHNYVVYDCAMPSRLPLPENAEVGESLPENPEAGEPLPEKPVTGFAVSGKHGRYNKNSKIIKTHSPLTPQGGEEEDSQFNKLKAGWLPTSLPDNLALAQGLFRSLSPVDRRMAAERAATFCEVQSLRRLPATMIPYLKSRAFREFEDAPPIDKDGDFVITPKRGEWLPWLATIRADHGEDAAQRTIKRGLIVRKTRWPNRHPVEQQFSMENG